MKLKSIEEHNEEVLHRSKNKYSTGIECPKCGDELQLTTGMVMLSLPPQADVTCFSCNYKNRIYV